MANVRTERTGAHRRKEKLQTVFNLKDPIMDKVDVFKVYEIIL